MENTVYRLAGADAVGIVGVGIAVEGFQLSSLFLGQGMTEVINRVALDIVRDRLLAAGGEQISPILIAVGIHNTVLGLDIAVIVIGHGVNNLTVDRFGKKLTQSIIGVGRGVGDPAAVHGIGLLNGGDPLLGIVVIGEGSAIGQEDLVDKQFEEI